MSRHDLAVSAVSSSAELTSKFTSNPLLFPGSSPMSQLSVSKPAAQHAAGWFLVVEDALSHHRAFPRHFSPLLAAGCPQSLCPCSHPWKRSCLSAVTSVSAHVPGPDPGRQELAPHPLTARKRSPFPILTLYCFKTSPGTVSGGGSRQCSTGWVPLARLPS